MRGVPAAAVLVLAVAVLTGCTDDGTPGSPARPTPVAIEDLDLSGIAAVRTPFCEALDPGRLSEVLGGAPRRSGSHAPGDRVRLAPGLVDVVSEHGCTFSRGQVTARTWLFAQPVTRGQARGYVASRRDPGCAAAGELEFGRPGVVQACRGGRVTMAGLFGSGWLTCEVRDGARRGVPDRELLDRAQRWCAAVATTVGSP